MSAGKAERFVWTQEEFLAAHEDRIPRSGQRWGNWRLSTSNPPSLDYVGGMYKYSPYEVVLSWIFRPGDGYRVGPGFLGWIKHLHDKRWGNESMGDFIDAVLTIGRYGYMKGSKHITVWPKDASEF